MQPVSSRQPQPSTNDPPRPLQRDGMDLWNRITSNYNVEDEGGREILHSACTALDLAEQCRAQILEEGTVVRNNPHPLLKVELANRTFVVRTLVRLGVNHEPVKMPGRPGGIFSGWDPSAQPLNRRK